MKKKLAVLLGVLVLSSVAFSAPAKKAPAGGSSLESSLSSLEAQLQRLEQMENKKFEEQEAVANATIIISLLAPTSSATGASTGIVAAASPEEEGITKVIGI